MLVWIHDLQSALCGPLVLRFYWHEFGAALVENVLTYVGVSLAFWGGLHVLWRKRLAHRLISGWPRRGDVRREIAYSASSLLLYSAGVAAILGMVAEGRVEIYANPRQHGLAWLLLSLPVLLVWQDLCFYATHRLMHTRWMFRHVHGVHHRSREPSPWAAYAMHPVEAMVNGGLPLLALAVAPVQEHVLGLFVLHQVVRNVHGHAAIESLPRSFTRHWFWGRFTTTTHHHLHHETSQGNYGLWFTWWDRLFGTERADYLVRFDRASACRSE